jgi:hypothetical protein
MQTLLENPAVQAAAAPFLVALVLAFILRRWQPVWQGLALMAGVLVAVWLTTGLSFQPLTSTRKIILCSLGLPFLALLFDGIGRSARGRVAAMLPSLVAAPLLASAAIWVAWPVLSRQHGWAFWAMAGQVAVYAMVIAWALLSLLPGRSQAAESERNNAQQLVTARFAQQGGAILALAMGTGAAAVIGASALYGQLAFAVAASTGALLLATLLLWQWQGEEGMTDLQSMALLAAAVPLGLLGAAASIYAKLPATALLFLACAPLVVRLPLIPVVNPWIRLTLSTLLAAVPVGPALWLTWRAAGPVSF